MKATNLILAVMCVALASATALADDGYVAPPADGGSTLARVAALVLVVGAIAAIAFKNTKRTHLD